MKMIKTHSCPFIFSSLQHNAWNKAGIKYCGMNEVSFHSEVWGHTHVFYLYFWAGFSPSSFMFFQAQKLEI